MIGREPELGAIARALTSTTDLPMTVVLAGEPGIGKTTVWHAAIARAAADGMRVLSSHPAGTEVRLTFSGLTDLLSPVIDEVLPALPDPQAHALEVALLRVEEGRRRLDERAVLAAVLTALRTLAVERPLCIAVDDAQWMDAPSADALAYAARRLRSEPIAYLLAIRTGPLATDPAPLASAMPAERINRTTLEGMSIGALHHLIRARLGHAPNRPALRRIHETAGGNPFYALELAAGMGPEGLMPGQPLPLSTSLEQLLEERLASLPIASREALLVAAAAPRPTVGLLRGIFGRSADQRLAPAERAGIVAIDADVIVFTHPLLASAAYGRSQTEHRRWHARLSALATDVEDAARHRTLASDGPDEELADVLIRAGRHARSRGAPAVAAELFASAVARTPATEPVRRAERIVEVAPTLALVGERTTARALIESVASTAAAGPLRSDALRLLADLVSDDPGGADLSTGLLERALAEAGTDPVRRAWVLLDLEMLERSRNRQREALAIARRALALAEETDDRELLTHALTRTADLEVLQGLGGDPTERFARAISLDRETQIDPALGPVAMLAVCLIRAGRLAEARPLLHSAERRARDEGDETGRIQLGLFLAELEWLAGNWEVAWTHGTEALEIAEQGRAWALHAAVSVPIALVEGGRGAVGAAVARAEAAFASCGRVGEVAYAEYNRQAIGSLELANGDVAAAEAMLGGYSVETGVEGGKRISFIGDEIEALVQLDREAQARELIAEVERRASLLRRPPLSGVAQRGRALLAARGGNVDEAEAVLAESIQTFDALGMPLERARSLMVLGVTRRRSKAKRSARVALEEAAAEFERIGARVWGDRAHRELARIGGRTASDGLTATEQRVAELVAGGLSNKEVAAELFVSVRAVEANLSRIYAKLEIGSRTELVRRV